MTIIIIGTARIWGGGSGDLGGPLSSGNSYDRRLARIARLAKSD